MLKEIKESRLSVKQKRIFTAIALVLVFIFTGIIAILVGKPMIEFVNKPDEFRAFVDSHGILSDVVFVLMVIFQMIMAFIPGEPFEIAAGYAFGYIRGSIDCLIAFALGGLLIFLAVRKFGVKIVEIFFSIDKIRELKFLQNPKRLNTTTFIIFLIPGTPKDLLSYFVGLTDMKLSVWMFITVVARIPSLVTSVLTGGALGSKKYGIAVIAFAVTLVLSGIGILIYNKIKKKHNG